MKHPTETTEAEMEAARQFLAAASNLVDDLLNSGAVEDAVFIERLRGAFTTGGLNLRLILDVPGGGHSFPRLLLQSVDRKGNSKTVSEMTFKLSPHGHDLLQ